MDFANWYKRRLGRIYPTILATGLIAILVFGKQMSFLDVMTANDYWFLQCILVCYLLLYPIIYFRWKLSVCILFSIAVIVVAYFFFFDFDGQMFYGVDNYFRWIFYFSVMLIGGGVYFQNDKIKYKHWHLCAMILCVVAWYGVNYIAKSYDCLGILSMLPLVGGCCFCYAIGKSPWVERLFKLRICGSIIFIIGNLCLESYLIQKYVFTDALNFLFPLNIPIIMVLVLLTAYALHFISVLIEQIFDSKPFNYKTLFLHR